MKKLLSLIVAICIYNLCFSQVTMVTNGFSAPTSNTQDLSLCDTKDLGITFPITEQVLKYDKIVCFIYQRPKNDATKAFKYINSSYFNEVAFFPPKKRFRDQKRVECYIIHPKEIKKIGLINASGERVCKLDYLTKSEFKVFVLGYYKDGSEMYWDEYSKSYKERNLYDEPVTLFSSEAFSFKRDEASAKKIEAEKSAKKAETERSAKALEAEKSAKALKEKQKEQHNAKYEQIKEKYLAVIKVPRVGEVQARKPIFTAYELLEKKLLQDQDYATLDKIDSKLISINKKYSKLKTLLKGETNTEVIQSTILNFEF